MKKNQSLEVFANAPVHQAVFKNTIPSWAQPVAAVLSLLLAVFLYI